MSQIVFGTKLGNVVGTPPYCLYHLSSNLYVCINNSEICKLHNLQFRPLGRST